MKLNTKIIIAGRAHSGKTRLAAMLAENLKVPVLKTCTSRPKRSPDEDTYIFYAPEEAAEIPMADKLFHTLAVDGYERWTDRASFLGAGIAILDPTGIPDAVRLWQAHGYVVQIVYVSADTPARYAHWLAASKKDTETAMADFAVREHTEAPMFDALEETLDEYASKLGPGKTAYVERALTPLPPVFGEDFLSVWDNSYDPDDMERYARWLARTVSVHNAPRGGWRRFPVNGPIILVPGDWTETEWRVLCRLAGLEPELTCRMELSAASVEFFTDPVAENVYKKEETPT